MVFKSKNLLSVAVMGITLSTMCNSAMAASIALSTTHISNFSMSKDVTFSGFTFSNDTSATESGGTGGADTLDAPAACVGDCVGWENQFGSHAPYTTEFSYGDAWIADTDIQGLGTVGGGTGTALSIGEVMVTDGIAHASGSNVMTSIGFFNSVSDAIIDFSFFADVTMETSVSGTGVSSAANTFFSITLTDTFNNTAFSWAPNELNHGISGNSTYNFSDLLSIQTGPLAAGDYTLNIKMENQVNGAAVVPVPAAAWLFGSGLIGLIGIARRKKS